MFETPIADILLFPFHFFTASSPEFPCTSFPWLYTKSWSNNSNITSDNILEMYIQIQRKCIPVTCHWWIYLFLLILFKCNPSLSANFEITLTSCYCSAGVAVRLEPEKDFRFGYCESLSHFKAKFKSEIIHSDFTFNYDDLIIMKDAVCRCLGWI